MAESRFWPTIDSSEKAIELMHYGSAAAALGSVITAAFSFTAIYLEHPVWGMDGWGLVDAAILAVIAWRVYRLSLPWAITGVVFFTIAKIYGFANNPRMGGGLIVAVIFFLAYLHSVRGGLYLRRAKKATSDILTKQKRQDDPSRVLGKIRDGGYYFYDLDITHEEVESLGSVNPMQH